MFERKAYMDWFKAAKGNGFIKVVTGVRRSGKSFMLNSYIEYLMALGIDPSCIHYYNFEHPDTFHLKSSTALWEDIKLKKIEEHQETYFLFDEIQEVENWQQLINGLRVAYKSDITITGSNAHLLSGELATYLAGRTIELCVYPLSFAEFKTFNANGSDNDSLFQEYLKWGGFPALPEIESESIRQLVLEGIYTSILYKDVAARGDIKDTALLDRIVAYLLDTIGSPISLKAISDVINADGFKTNPTTIDRYLGLLESSFTFYRALRYDIRGKKRLRTLAKFYTVDTGLRNASFGRVGNLGSQLENIVYLELRRRGYKVFVGKLDDTEVDFICFRGNEVSYFQVAYQIPLHSNREHTSLLKIPDNHNKMILTFNRMDVGIVDGIPVVHVVDWLLEQQPSVL